MGQRRFLWAGLALAVTGLTFGSAAQAQPLDDPRYVERPFVRWSDTSRRLTIDIIGGVSREIAATGGPGGFTSFGAPSATLDVTYRQWTGEKNLPTGYVVKNAGREISFIPANGDTYDYGSRAFTPNPAGPDARIGFLLLRASDWSRQLTYIEPGVIPIAARHQVFGFWQTGVGMSAGSIGGFSVGAMTSAANTPQAGLAQFTGTVSGLHVDESGQGAMVFGALGMAVDFAAHTADFWSTQIVDLDGRAHDDLNMTGKFVGLANDSRLFGTIETATLTGASVAHFYGPAADEVGGVFTLTPKSGLGLQRFAGGFGAVRGAPPPPALNTGAGFTLWSELLKPSTTVTAAGLSNNEKNFPLSGPAAFTETLDAAGGVTGLKMQTSLVSVSFYTANGDTIVRAPDPRYLLAKASDWSRKALVADPKAMGWEYQTFGAWERGPRSSLLGANAISTGAVTPTANLPTTGVAQFSGSIGGVYFDEFGAGHMISGSAVAGVDFAARTIQFNAGGFADVATGHTYFNASVDGVLKINGSVAQETMGGLFARGFSGSRLMAGVAWANFYGPNAQELGGAFDLEEAPGGLRFTGGFGLKR